MNMFVESCIDSIEVLRYTNLRYVEFNFSPMPDVIDRDYIKEINKYIFQDLNKLHIAYKAGEFRSENEELSSLNIKVFKLSNNSELYAVRSLMNKDALDKLDSLLKNIDIQKLTSLTLGDFTKEICNLYINLDYLGLFEDGNSRTLRAFLSRIAIACGYKINFAKVAFSNKLRDSFYMARCKDTNKIAISDKDLNFHKETIFKINRILDEKDSLLDLFNKEKLIVPIYALEFKDEIQYVFNVTEDSAHLFPKNLENSMQSLSSRFPILKESNNLLISLCNEVYNSADNSIEAYRDTASLLPSFNRYLSMGITNITRNMILQKQ